MVLVGLGSRAAWERNRPSEALGEGGDGEMDLDSSCLKGRGVKGWVGRGRQERAVQPQERDRQQRGWGGISRTCRDLGGTDFWSH